MRTDNKEELLNALEQRVEQHLQLATSRFQNMPSDALLKPAAKGGWSIAQCLEHLNAYGHYYLPQINRSLQRSKKNSHTFKSSWLGSYFTAMMEPETGKRKTKAFKAYVPASELDAHAVVAEFIQQQEHLFKYIEAARQADLNIRIPISISRWIRLKLGDVLQFVIAHNERHIQQAMRNVQDPS